jgi:hypothetical protein
LLRPNVIFPLKPLSLKETKLIFLPDKNIPTARDLAIVLLDDSIKLVLSRFG